MNKSPFGVEIPKNNFTKALAFHPSEPILAISSRMSNKVKIIKIDPLTLSFDCIDELEGHTDLVNDITFHLIKNLIATCSNDNTIKLWKYYRLFPAYWKNTMKGHTGPVLCTRFHNTLPIIVSGSLDTNVKLWKYNDDYITECIATFNHSKIGFYEYDSVTSLAFHTTQPILFTTHTRPFLKIWKINEDFSVLDKGKIRPYVDQLEPVIDI